VLDEKLTELLAGYPVGRYRFVPDRVRESDPYEPLVECVLRHVSHLGCIIARQDDTLGKDVVSLLSGLAGAVTKAGIEAADASMEALGSVGTAAAQASNWDTVESAVQTIGSIAAGTPYENYSYRMKDGPIDDLAYNSLINAALRALRSIQRPASQNLPRGILDRLGSALGSIGKAVSSRRADRLQTMVGSSPHSEAIIVTAQIYERCVGDHIDRYDVFVKLDESIIVVRFIDPLVDIARNCHAKGYYRDVASQLSDFSRITAAVWYIGSLGALAELSEVREHSAGALANLARMCPNTVEHEWERLGRRLEGLGENSKVVALYERFAYLDEQLSSGEGAE